MPTIPGLTSPLTAAAYGDRYGLDATVVVVHIRKGTLAGTRHGTVWYAEDVPPPALLSSDRPPAADRRAGDREESWPTPRRVVRYTSRTYVNVLMGIIAALIVVDLVEFVLSWDGRALRGIGFRALVLWALHARHRWARRAVYAWAGTLVVAGVAGMVVVAPAGLTTLATLPAVLLLGGMALCGLFYLATVHRFIRVEPETDLASLTLDDIGREARLD